MEILNDIINYCNDNEGFFSALLGFLAILISVLTYYNQKKEQTKNAQENAKLQRELTEQNNKLQADLQLRQIKLEKYNLLIINWRNLYKLRNLIIILTQSLKVDIQNEKETIESEDIKIDDFYCLYKIFINDDDENFLSNILCYLNELIFIFDKSKFEKIEQSLDLVYKFYMLIKSCHYHAQTNFSSVSEERKKEIPQGIIEILKLLYDDINEIVIELAHEINEYDLKHIQNIERN